MKIGVCMNSNGHFRAAKLTDRTELLKVIEAVNDGEHYDYIVEKNKFDFTNVDTISQDDWDNIIRHFEQRGTFEIVNI
jgi:hypothetical protein